MPFTSPYAAAAVDFGTDISVFPGLDLSFGLMRGQRVVLEAVLKRWTTRRGLLWAHPEYGWDVRGYLNESITDDVLSDIEANARAEALEDERVQSCDVTVVYLAATDTLQLIGSVVTAQGPFQFVLGVTSLTVELLEAQ